MESITFNIENHSITYNVNWLGFESISVNGNVISKKLSLGKRVHTFDLRIHGVSQTFHIESKQSFTHCNITVRLFENNVILDTKALDLYTQMIGPKNQAESASNSNGMFVIGMLIIVLSLRFDLSNFFLFAGLIFLFSAISPTKAIEHKKDTALKD